MLYNSSLIVYANRPDGFNPRFQVISCYCLFKDKILFLQKSAKDKLEPNKWEVIIGKKHKNEEDEKALIRIIKEEIDVDLSKFNKKDFIRSNYFYLRSNNFDFLQTNYIFRFENLPKIKLSSQHQHFFGQN